MGKYACTLHQIISAVDDQEYLNKAEQPYNDTTLSKAQKRRRRKEETTILKQIQKKCVFSN